MDFVDVHNIEEPIAGAFMYSAAPGNMTVAITTADTWTYMTGTHVTEEAQEFTVDATGTHYTGTPTRKFVVSASATAKFSTAGAEVHFGYEYNGIIYAPSIAGNYMANIGQPYSISGTSVIELATNDTIRFVAKCNNKTGTITINHYGAVVTPWGR